MAFHIMPLSCIENPSFHIYPQESCTFVLLEEFIFAIVWASILVLSVAGICSLGVGECTVVIGLECILAVEKRKVECISALEEEVHSASMLLQEE